MADFQNIQMFIIVVVAMLCFATALFTLIIKYQSVFRKQSIFHLEMSACFLLVADIFAYASDGVMASWAYWANRISNFLLFFFLYFILIAFNNYLLSLIVGKGKLEETPKEIEFCKKLIKCGAGLLVVSQVAGWYYYFDEMNVYHRGPLFAVSFVVPFLVSAIQFKIIVQYRKLVALSVYVSLLVFLGLPLIAVVVQTFWYGTSLLNISVGIAGIVVFCQSLIEHNAFLTRTASTDQMTGLPNAYGFLSEIGKKVHFGEITQYNGFYFDMVKMVSVNRKFGNDIGDRVIALYVEEVKTYLIKGEVLGRLGGNYFVALIRKEHTDEFLEKIAGVDLEIEVRGEMEALTIAAVAGVYPIEDEHISPETVLTNSAIAVNMAKNVKRKPYVFFSKELQRELDDTRRMMELIPKGMALKEFKPYYQPKVNSKTGKLIGAEALVRWEHIGAIIPPMRYIPLMEQNDSICKFDLYMLDYVCSDIREWLDKGIDVPVISVNLSRRNLGNVNLAKEIAEIISRHNVPAQLIQIEITETIDEYPLERLRAVVKELKNYGVSSAIDDFGTGSASIKMLRDVNFDVLKIDKSFVDNILDGDRKILECIVEMAKVIGTEVIAEGVEELEQVKILNSIGCYAVQGYFFDKPLNKAVFEERMCGTTYTVEG